MSKISLIYALQCKFTNYYYLSLLCSTNSTINSNPEDRPTAEQLLTHPFVQPDASFEFKVK